MIKTKKVVTQENITKVALLNEKKALLQAHKLKEAKKGSKLDQMIEEAKTRTMEMSTPTE